LAGIRDDRPAVPEGRADGVVFFVGVDGPASPEGVGGFRFVGVGRVAGSGFSLSGIGTTNGSSKS
jgi:hypothetical protein